MSDAWRRVSRSEAETEAVGRSLAVGLRRGDLLALRGELGAGKTCLVRGIAAGLGVDPLQVRSPTFVLHHVYAAGRLALHHVDCYRLGAGAELNVLDLDALLEDGAVAVEWSELADLSRLWPVVIDIDSSHPGSRVMTMDAGAPQRLADAFMSVTAQT